MSTTKYKDFVVTFEGWIIVLSVLLLAYPAYYLKLYPVIIQKMEYINVVLAPDAQKMLTQEFATTQTGSDVPEIDTNLMQVSFESNRYLTNFQDGKVVIVVENNTSQRRQGCLYLEGDLKKTNTNVPLAQVHFPISTQYTITVGLSSGESASYEIPIHLNSAEAEQVEFKLFYFDGIDSSNGSCFVDTNNTSLRHDLSWASINKLCSPLADTVEYICVPMNAWKGFIQSTMHLLLLPPWSNRILPFVAFGIVWMVEQILEPLYRRKKVNSSSRNLLQQVMLTVFTFILAVLSLYLLYGYITLIINSGQMEIVLAPVLVVPLVFVLLRFVIRRAYAHDEIENIYIAKYKLDIERLEVMLIDVETESEKALIRQFIEDVRNDLQEQLGEVLTYIAEKEFGKAQKQAKSLDSRGVRTLVDLNGDLCDWEKKIGQKIGTYYESMGRWKLEEKVTVSQVTNWIIDCNDT